MMARRPLVRAAIWAAVLIALVGVFMLYLRPDLVFALATQVWNCF
jgi:hypothetical protein